MNQTTPPVCAAIEARYRAIMDAAADAIVIMGADCRVIAFSRGAEALFGFTAAEVLGRNIDMLLPQPHAGLHDGYVRRYLQTGEKHVIGIGRDVLARRRDGSTFPAYLSVGEAEFESGRVFVGILHDASSETQAMRRVAQLAAIVDSAGDAVIAKSLDGLVTYWNKGAEELYGYTAPEAVGRHISFIVPPERREELDAIFATLAKGREVSRIETQRLDKHAAYKAVSLTISPIIDEFGQVTGASSIARDITARRQAELAMAEARHAAEEANRVKTDFLNIISHELRTPLTIILGNISLLTDRADMPAPAEAAEIAKDIEGSANQLLAIINNLLDISDMEAGQARLRLTPVQAADLVEEVAAAARPLAQAKGLAFTVEAVPVELLADPLRLKQALLNLIDNAVKFTATGAIRLAVFPAGRMAVFEVSDTGQGIPPQEIDRVFVAFHQADTSSTRQAPGTGLGLTIVKRIVELHAGRINVESEPGQGSTFYLALPLEPPEEPPASDPLESADA